jgi:hypothetical protein
MGIVQDSLQVVKVAARLANPELLERVTALNEQVLDLSSKNVELQERVFGLGRELQQANEAEPHWRSRTQGRFHLPQRGDRTKLPPLFRRGPEDSPYR